MIICPETPPDQVKNLTERILEGVRQHRFPTQKPMTVSAGIANLSTGDTMTSLTQRADEALYQAKAAGRDRIHVASDFPSSSPVEGADKVGFVQLVWRPAYECGNAVIDRQHQELFLHANALLAAMLAGKPVTDIAACIDGLIAKAVEHFKDEEAILAEVGFIDFEQHAILHRQLVDRATELAGLFYTEKLGFGELFQFIANDVVARHMLIEDRKFFSIFRPMS